MLALFWFQPLQYFKGLCIPFNLFSPFNLLHIILLKTEIHNKYYICIIIYENAYNIISIRKMIVENKISVLTHTHAQWHMSPYLLTFLMPLGLEDIFRFYTPPPPQLHTGPVYNFSLSFLRERERVLGGFLDKYI